MNDVGRNAARPSGPAALPWVTYSGSKIPSTWANRPRPEDWWSGLLAGVTKTVLRPPSPAPGSR